MPDLCLRSFVGYRTRVKQPEVTPSGAWLLEAARSLRHVPGRRQNRELNDNIQCTNSLRGNSVATTCESQAGSDRCW